MPTKFLAPVIMTWVFFLSQPAFGQELPNFDTLKKTLQEVVKEKNGGFGFNMWATVVDRDGVVRAVVFSGEERGDQWPGSRVISAQKANTANAFSLPGFALSTANLYSAVQPDGSLYGLQHSNPVDTSAAYGGPIKLIGTQRDPMVGKKIGGINVFGGGLPLYNKEGKLLGAIGVSGDSSCADHNVAWKIRHLLQLDYVPAGVSPFNDDNIVNDITKGESPSGWGHPICVPAAADIAKGFAKTHPVRTKSE
ncbi:MAG: heme-binding protein [Deltaproteobacteria bacterium]|nr:heme-binding protein [Deltaproteobacteria bacterium]